VAEDASLRQLWPHERGGLGEHVAEGATERQVWLHERGLANMWPKMLRCDVCGYMNEGLGEHVAEGATERQVWLHERGLANVWPKVPRSDRFGYMNEGGRSLLAERERNLEQIPGSVSIPGYNVRSHVEAGSERVTQPRRSENEPVSVVSPWQ
jgi:hypothetical protein